jgi:hypothetical protein
MALLKKVLQLPVRERQLVVRAALLCAAIRVGLWLMRLRTLRRALDRISWSTGAPKDPGRLDAEQISWAVAAASRFVPGSTCLTRALAVAVLLQRRKYPAHLRIGFIRTPDRRLRGHAWVESEGRVVIGKGDLSGYTPLPLCENAPSKIGWAA